MDTANFISIMAVALVVIPSALTMLLQSAYYFKGRRFIQKNVKWSIDGEISIVIPVRKEPLELLEACISRIHRWSIIDKVEVIIVSDDDEAFLENLRVIVDKWRANGLKVQYAWRSEARGYRTGALNVGLYLSRGKYVYIMDVDSIVNEEFFHKSIKILSEEGAWCVVGRWYTINEDSRLSQAISYSMNYIVDSIYRGRSSLNLLIMPTGTGTLFKREVLTDVLRGWDEERIQDDMDIGVRIHCMGGSVEYIDEESVGVLAPSRFKSFRIQQGRWAYGATDVLLSRFKLIVSCKKSFLKKFELALFLLQYLPVALTFIGAIALAVTSTIYGVDPLKSYWQLGLVWLFISVFYIASFIDSNTHRGKDALNSIINLGRISAVTTAVSPEVFLGILKALLRVKIGYRRTPKGVFEVKGERLRIPLELLFLIVFISLGILLVARNALFTGGLLLLYSTGYLYTAIRWPKDLFID